LLLKTGLHNKNNIQTKEKNNMSTPGITNFFFSNNGTVRIKVETKRAAIEISNGVAIGVPITIHQADPLRRVREDNQHVTAQAMGFRPEFLRAAEAYEVSHAVIRDEEKEDEEKKDSCCERLSHIFKCGW
jgi:transcriptional/translational regulatory protein YebC/TACO1